MKRNKYTETQTKLSSEERKQNMEMAFEVTKQLNGKKIALVDDVLTTGSTISACAMRLKEMGSPFVIAITCCTPKFET